MLAACAALALVAAAPAGAHARDGGGGGCVAGAAGIGDPYYPTYGNGGYDVHHYELDIAYDPATDRLDGEASIFMRSTQRLCTFNLDLVGLTVQSVRINGRAVPFTREGQELTVRPPLPIRKDKRFEVEVRYGGVPVEFTIPYEGGFMTTGDGATVLGQPEVATAWFPANDHPLDKASFGFNVTVPEGYEVVANGLPEGTSTREGRTTFRWRAREGMAPYLATIDIGQWDFHDWETERGLRVIDAVDPAIEAPLRAAIDASLARQGEIIDVLSARFGPYPFSTVGAIVEGQDDLFFALETQTRPVYGKVFWTDPEGNPANGDFVVVHELAHQWFGNDAAIARWQDIWLNEGFATYAEWMWTEREGQGTIQESFQAIYDAPADHPAFGEAFWSVPIGDPGVERLFHAAVYYRGAMTLQALRNEVGDDAFWRIVRTWARTNANGHVTTEEFIAHAEAVSGRELDALFTAWLFTAAKPAVEGAQQRRAADAEAGVLQSRRGALAAAAHARRPHAHR